MLFPELMPPSTFGVHITRGDVVEAKKWLNDRNIYMQDIINAVSDETGISVKDILARTRSNQAACRARQVAMWLCHRVTKKSYVRIGYFFERDHTTIIHAKRRVDERREKFINVRMQTDRLLDAFGMGSAT